MHPKQEKSWESDYIGSPLPHSLRRVVRNKPVYRHRRLLHPAVVGKAGQEGEARPARIFFVRSLGKYASMARVSSIVDMSERSPAQRARYATYRECKLGNA